MSNKDKLAEICLELSRIENALHDIGVIANEFDLPEQFHEYNDMATAMEGIAELASRQLAAIEDELDRIQNED